MFVAYKKELNQALAFHSFQVMVNLPKHWKPHPAAYGEDRFFSRRF
jgi:hypothetical protein